MKLKMYERLFFLCCILFGAVCFFTACGINPTATVEGVIPLISAILGIAGTVGETILPAEATLIQAGMTLCINGLNALLSTLKSYDANKSSPGALAILQAAFTAVQSNLNQLETAAQVKDPDTAKKLGAVINGVIATIAALEAYIVAKQPAATSDATS